MIRLKPRRALLAVAYMLAVFALSSIPPRELHAWGLRLDPLTPTLKDLEDQLRWADPQLAAVMVASQQARLDAITRTLAERIGRAAGPGREEQEKRFTADRWP